MTTALTASSTDPASLLQSARIAAGLGLRALARRAGTSHATLSAYEKGTKTPTTATFIRILEAAGYALEFQLSPRVREAEGLDRGEELRQVLVLAGEFPSRPTPTLDYPVLKDLPTVP